MRRLPLGTMRPYDTAWGAIADPVAVTVAQTGMTSNDITGLAITFNAILGRRYRVHGQVRLVQQTTSAVVTLQLMTSGGTVVDEDSCTRSAGDTFRPKVEAFVTPTTGQVTYKLHCVNGSGTMDTIVDATRPGIISVIDVGPDV